MLDVSSGCGKVCLPGFAHDGKSCQSSRPPPMPSPLGHALTGMAVGWVIADPVVPARRRVVEPAIFGAIAAAPDLDILVGAHRMYTHSVGAVLVVLVIARWMLGPGQWRLALAVAAAWASHVLLDWLGSDTSPPIGLMALWPFSDDYYISPFGLFDEISRRYWLPQEFIWNNLAAALKEVAIIGPFAVAALAVARWRRLHPGAASAARDRP